IEHPLAGPHRQSLQYPDAASRFAAGGGVLEPVAVGDRMAAEDAGDDVFRLHAHPGGTGQPPGVTDASTAATALPAHNLARMAGTRPCGRSRRIRTRTSP